MKAVIVSILVICTCAVAREDLTRMPKAKGGDVVRTVVDMIQESEIFPDDKQLLRRIAYVETKDGYVNYRRKQGIWGITREMLLKTKDDQSLQLNRNAISTTFNISWPGVRISELSKPLYSGLAARLFLSTISEPIPEQGDIDGQADYYKRHYPSGKLWCSIISCVVIRHYRYN